MRLTRLAVALLCASACTDAPRSEQAAETGPVGQTPSQQVFTYRACDDAPPGSLVQLPRVVSADRDPAAAAIRELVRGVNEEERRRGCTSFFSSSTANAVRDVSRSAGGDTLIVDFHGFTAAIPDDAGARSFLPPGIMAELTWTIFKQFPELSAVRFSIDGDERGFWNWVGGEGTPPQVYTRRMWERI